MTNPPDNVIKFRPARPRARKPRSSVATPVCAVHVPVTPDERERWARAARASRHKTLPELVRAAVEYYISTDE